MKKKYKHHVLIHLLQKKIKMKWDRPFLTFYGKTLYTVKQRYRYMIQRRTRCNEYARQCIQQYMEYSNQNNK